MGGEKEGVGGESEKAFNMITAGMDTREERQRGSRGGKEGAAAWACQYR